MLPYSLSEAKGTHTILQPLMVRIIFSISAIVLLLKSKVTKACKIEFVTTKYLETWKLFSFTTMQLRKVRLMKELQ